MAPDHTAPTGSAMGANELRQKADDGCHADLFGAEGADLHRLFGGCLEIVRHKGEH